MGESGKRSRSHRNNNGDGKNQKRRTNEKDENSNDEFVIYRILCPDGIIGSVIGKSGKVINSIRQDTGARIKVVDPFPGAKDRVLTIYSHVKNKEDVEVDDEFNDKQPLCAAQDALLKVHAAIANAVANTTDSEKKQRDKEECQILVPSSQSANIIGKAGATIKRLRSKTRTSIRVTPKDAADPTHSCSMEFDNFVMISGESEAVKQALFAISAIIYKFSPREDIPLGTTVPEASPSIIIPSDFPIYPLGGLYSNAHSILPSRSVPSIVGAAHVPDFQGYADTGNAWPVYSAGLSGVSGNTGASRSEELIIRVLCPFNKIGRVIGKGGGTIKSTRQASGAQIDVDDTKDNRDDCIITVTATESAEDIQSTAVEAVLLLQTKINDEGDDTVTFRLLVSSKVIGCIIGKSGSIINEIRKRTKADVRISKGDIPKCAGVNDELVEVVGEVGSVRDAIVQIVLRLRDDALKDTKGQRNPPVGADPLYSGGSGISMPPHMPSSPPVAPLEYDQRADSGSGLGHLCSSSIYRYGSLRFFFEVPSSITCNIMPSSDLPSDALLGGVLVA